MLNKNNLIKSVIYRLYSSLITFIISYFFTGKLVLAASIGFLDMGLKIFSYYFFDEVWQQITGSKIKPSVIWLTGLSGSGKTTIANDLIKKLKKKSVIPVSLDGDEIRHAIKQHGFDEDSRKAHNLSVGYISSLFEKQGNVVVVSLISPYDDIRNEVRSMCNNFIEVYVSTDLSTCINRDPKGLYKKVQAGEIGNFTGISAPYFPPLNPEIIIDTSKLSVDNCSTLILNFLKK
jgi:adenylylsulfate kinase